MARLLITGGAGFIGSHTCLVLLEAGHELVVLDNYSNSSPEALRRVVELVGSGAESRLQVIEGDIRHSADLERAFAADASTGACVEAVIHFAGLKAVAESVAEPLRYWDVNVSGSQRLLAAMSAHGCRTLVFSSSATLYGHPETVPIPESAPIQPINPYGHTKAAVERMLCDVAASEAGWKIACLRYFNPAGAHPSGRIGEDPNGIPNNLFPFISQVAVGRIDRLKVFGDNWPTPDGSCIRDYIHVIDVAEGHLAALESLKSCEEQVIQLNLGSGCGYSVLEVVQAFELVSKIRIPFVITDPRHGDAAITTADTSEAQRRLNWRARRGLHEICKDFWTWQRTNPKGYQP